MQNHCEACERNKDHIFAELNRFLPEQDPCTIVEVGSGSGQHAIHFSRLKPNWDWQTTELEHNLAVLEQNRRQYHPQLSPPIAINVDALPWPCAQADAIFTANTLHIMSAASVENFYRGVAGSLKQQGQLIVYGPFKYQGQFTAPSNAKFDDWLKNRDSLSGIRDFEWVEQLAQSVGLSLLADKTMPANNQLLVWQKTI